MKATPLVSQYSGPLRWWAGLRRALCLIFWVGLLTLVLPSGLQAQEGNLRFDRLSIEDGLSQSTIFAILQDRQGFMWFGTQDGLNKYDGYTFTVYKNDPEDPTTISDNFVRAIHEDAAGRLWVGTNGGLNLFDPATETFSRYQHNSENPYSLSNNTVRAIFEDKAGVLWIGTDGGLNKLDLASGIFRHFRHNPADEHSLSHNTVRAIFEDQEGMLWLATEGGGLNKFDPVNEIFTVYRHEPDNPTSLSHDDLSAIQQDQSGRLWVSTEGGGLNMFDPASETFTVYQNDLNNPASLSDDNIRYIYEDKIGQLWVGARQGLNRFDPATDSFIRYYHDPANPHSLSANHILSIFEDRAGVLWIGTNGGGLNKFNRLIEAFTHFTNTPNNPTALSSNMVWSIIEDRAGNLWVGTSNGLNRIDRARGVSTYFHHDPADPTSLSNDFIPVVIEARAGGLWVGTDEGGLNKFDPATETFTAYRHDPNNPTSLSDDDVWSLYEDTQGTLWVGTWGGGLNKFDPANGTFTRYMNDPEQAGSLSDNVIRTIFEDHTGTLWLGTNGGGLNKFDRTAETFTVYTHDPQKLTSLSGNVVRTIYEDRNGVLWVGVDGGGLNKFDRDTETFVHYREKDGLVNDTIYGILEDEQGHLWLSTNNGLSRFDPRAETFKNYNVTDGLQSNEFNQGAYHKSRRSGELFFGGINGFNAFFPAKIQDNPYPPPVVLTAFQIFNQPVRLDRPLYEVTDIRLSYQDTVVSFEFAALDYTAPEENRYAYKLEGVDKDWVEAGQRRFATYTHLDGGEYTLRLKGANNDGVWNEEGVAIKLTVTPPPWKTWWAYILYAVAAGAVVAGYARYRTAAQAHELARQRRELEQERLVADQLRRVDRLKDEFLANTSHELRTPLNGIIGLAESLIDGAAGRLPVKATADLAMIVSSGRRLANLVNDILDFSQLKHKQLELHLKPIHMQGLTEVVLNLCQPLVGQKPVQLINRLSPELPPVMADENRVQQIMVNLVGNAVKFTERGQVEVLAEVVANSAGNPGATGVTDQLAITVADTGIGIPADSLERIFESFEQADGSAAREYGGTGLGLSITRQLVEMHGGAIYVESSPGQGARFTFTLPLAQGQPLTSQEMAATVGPKVIGPLTSPIDTQLLEPALPRLAGPNGTTILVVDDEPVNQHVLANYLGLKNYTIVQAMNGIEALKLIESKLTPDLVLLDVMMPRMSGFDVCRKLREKYSAIELPILILTAKNRPDDLVAGLEAGANDYIAKPFDKRELLARVDTLLRLKEAVGAHDQLVALEQELNVARHIQESILPPQIPSLAGLDMQVRYRPMNSVGGDLYDFYEIDDRRLGVFVADVSGHGVPAALIAAMAKVAFAMQKPIARSASMVLSNMNETLTDKIGRQLLTVSYVYFDLERRKLFHANAGHWPLLVWQKRAQTLRQLKPDGVIMGWLTGIDYPSLEIDLSPDDRILLYTDAILETRNKAGELFGEERFHRLIRQKQELAAAEFADFLVKHLIAWSEQDNGLEDDLTLIVIDILES